MNKVLFMISMVSALHADALNNIDWWERQRDVEAYAADGQYFVTVE